MTTIASRAGAGSLGVVKFGALQAKVELVIRFTRPSALGHLIVPIAPVLIFTNVDVSDVLGGQGAVGMLAGIAAASLFVGGFVGICGELVSEQDDGTMFRVRTLPYGLAGHLIGKTLSLLVTGVVTALLILIPAHIFVAPILPGTFAEWVALARCRGVDVVRHCDRGTRGVGGAGACPGAAGVAGDDPPPVRCSPGSPRAASCRAGLLTSEHPL